VSRKSASGQAAKEIRKAPLPEKLALCLLGPTPATCKEAYNIAAAFVEFYKNTGFSSSHKDLRWWESEQRLRKLILAARAQPVSVLFLDDVDGLLPRRGGNSVVDNRIVVQFLNEIGGFSESSNVLLLLGATNKPWDIDEAVFRTGRFDEKVFVGLPDKPAREFIIRKQIGATPVDPRFDAAAVADKLDGYTGSDIVAIVQSAKRAGFRRDLEGGAKMLTLDGIETAMKTIPSSTTPQMMKEYENFAKARFK